MIRNRFIKDEKNEIQKKLDVIFQQKSNLFEVIDKLISEANASAQSLLQIAENSKYMVARVSALHKLNKCCNTLFEVDAILNGDEDESGETSGHEGAEPDCAEETFPEPPQSARNTENTLIQTARNATTLTSDHPEPRIVEIENTSVASTSFLPSRCSVPSTVASVNPYLDTRTHVAATTMAAGAIDSTSLDGLPVAPSYSVLNYFPNVPILDLQTKIWFDVFLCYIDTPSLLHLRPAKSSLDSLVEAMNVHYQKNCPPALGCEPQIGMICSARYFDGDWYRAKIQRVIPGPDYSVSVYYIDYGNFEDLSPDMLRPLHESFTHLPRQAFECALSEVAPLVGHCWSDQAKVWLGKFRQSSQPIQARIPCLGIDGWLFVELRIGSLADVNRMMVNEGVARVAENSEIRRLLDLTPNWDAEVECSVPVERARVGKDEQRNILQLGAAPDDDLFVSDFVEKFPRNELDDVVDDAMDGEMEKCLQTCEDDEDEDATSDEYEDVTSDEDATSDRDENETGEKPLILQLGAVSDQVKGYEVVVPRDGYIRFMMAHINGPDSFYIHLVNKATGTKLDEMRDQMNDYYKSPPESMQRMFDDFRPSIGCLCCARFGQERNFYRAVARDLRKLSSQRVNKETGVVELYAVPEVYVYYVDYGNEEWIREDRVYPLKAQFKEIPAQAVRCRLADIKAVDGKWTAEAVEKFKELAGYNHQFLGYVNDDGEVLQEPLSLAVGNVDLDVWVNASLVSSGLVLVNFSKPVAQHNIIDEQNDPVFDNWSPMLNDYLSDLNTYGVDHDDAEIIVAGYKSSDAEKVCRFYGQSKAGCYRGDQCPFLHVEPEHGNYSESYVPDEQRAVCCMNDVEVIRCPAVDSWVAVRITSVFNPTRFYLHFPFGTSSLRGAHGAVDVEEGDGFQLDEGYAGSGVVEETLDQMMESLNHYYEQQVGRDGDMIDYAPCEIVVAELDKCWYRAKVIDAMDNGFVPVFYVDYGDSGWVAESSIRKIQPQFVHLPFQAQEAVIDNIVAIKGRWSGKAYNFFNGLIDGKTLFAHVLSSDRSGRIYIDLYNTESNECINIGNDMVTKGYAKRVDEDVNTSGPIPETGHIRYLLPAPETGEPIFLPG